MITDLAWSRDGKTLASSSDGEPAVFLWDVAAGRLTATIRMPDPAAGEGFCCLVFAGDGKTLFTGGERGILGWDVRPGSPALQPAVLRDRPGEP